MPDFIKNLEECVIVDNRFFCYDEIEKSMVECEVKPIGRSNIPKEAIIAYGMKQIELNKKGEG